MSQFYSIIHEQRFYKIRYPTSDNRLHNKFASSKMKNQQIYKNRHQIENQQKIPYEFPVRNIDFLSEASKSQTFIQPQSRLSISRLQKQRIALKKISNQHEEVNEERENGNESKRELADEKCDKSLQYLVGPKNNAYKTQYSKIARRKETIIKRNLVIEEGEQLEHKGRQYQQFSEEKLIEKYRQLMQQSRPLNLVNKLYQNDLLSTKLMPLSTKEKLLMTKLVRNEKQIQEKINKIVSKPSQYDTIRKMLLNIHDKIEESATYPYQSKDTLSKNETELIKTKEHWNKLTSLQKIDRKQDQMKRSEMSNQSANKNNRKEDPLSLSKKIDSQAYIPVNLIKQAFAPPKKVTSSAFIIYEAFNPLKHKLMKKLQTDVPKKKEYQHNLHSAYNIRVASQIASLTKIMTCIIIIEICEKYGITPKTERYKTGAFESYVHGTSADIQPGEIYSIHQLLHGLMLPSGNDASMALARWGGNILLLNDVQASKRSSNKQDCNDTLEIYTWTVHNKFLKSNQEKLKARRCYNRFIAEMNKKARILMMQRTSYANSHGLSNNLNRSCCLDLALLCEYAMQNVYFRQIVSCKQFSCVIEKEIDCLDEPRTKRQSKRKFLTYDPEEMNLQADAEDQETCDKSQCDQDELRESSALIKKCQYTQKQINWTNTHKLLHEKTEYLGIKTGVTATAGPCLASYLQIKGRKFIIIVLNSKKLAQRFVDTEILKNWLIRKQKLFSQSRLKLSQQQGQAQT